MKQYLRWFYLLTLRLYKKPSFVAIMVLIPLCVLGFAIASKGDSGFLHIILVQQNENDEISSEIVSELLNEETIIRFSVADNESDAVDAVKTGKADAAWIFPKELDEKIDKFIDSSYLKDGFVTVLEREASVSLRLSREKLSSVLFKHLARSYYLNFTRDNGLSEFDGYSDETLLEFFDTVKINEELFTVTDVDGNKSESANTSYLTAPIRGLLSIVVMFSGMAAAMYCIRDEMQGTFSWMAENKRIYVQIVSVFTAVINVSAMAFIAINVSGLSTGFFRELVSTILFTLCCTAFCLLLKQLFRSITLYGSMIPMLSVVMVAVCPVFFDYKQIRYLQALFPPTLYIKSSYDNAYLVYMALYALICFMICIITDGLSRKKIFKIK